MSYPVAGGVKEFQPAGYDVDHALVPHGISVILNTPAVVRFTAPADPGRHLRAAEALGGEIDGGYVRWNFFTDTTVTVDGEVWEDGGRLVVS